MSPSSSWIPVSGRHKARTPVARSAPTLRLPARLLGVVTAGMVSVMSMVVIAPLAAVGSAVPTEAPPPAEPVVSLVAAETTPEPEPTTTITNPLPSSPPPSVDLEAAALAGRPDPGIVPEAPVETTAVPTTASSSSSASSAPSPSSSSSSTTVAEVDALEALSMDAPPTTGPPDPFDCRWDASALELVGSDGVYDRNLVAQLTHTVFECVATAHGYDERAVESTGSWDAGIWGFGNMAELIAAEAVVVGYCESIAFEPSAISGDNPWGYGGVFQMGDREMALFGFPGASKFQPADNVYSAATYLLANAERGLPWGGWGPWAVVNTGYNDEVNDKVKIPVLPRFESTDPDYRGRRGVELPRWAVDPWSWEVPSFDGCPFTGRDWPESVRWSGLPI